MDGWTLIQTTGHLQSELLPKMIKNLNTKLYEWSDGRKLFIGGCCHFYSRHSGVFLFSSVLGLEWVTQPVLMNPILLGKSDLTLDCVAAGAPSDTMIGTDFVLQSIIYITATSSLRSTF